jgi:uncharacterized membrane protein YbhN (UPF0104 family)
LGGKVLVAGFLLAGLAFHAEMMGKAWRELRAVSIASMVVLLVATLVHRGVHAMLVERSSPGLRWHRAVVVSEAHAGCANSMVGGGAVGTGLKAAMLRSYGLDGTDVATSIVAAGAVPSIAMWLMALANTGPQVLAGTASPFHATVAAVALAVVLGQLVFWWVALIHPGPARRAGNVMDRVVPRLHRRCRGPLRPLRRHLSHVEGRHVTEAVRRRGLDLLRTRGATLLATGLVAQVTLAIVMLLSLRSVGAHGASLFEVLEVFAITRVAASFVPLPGGVGVFDVGLFSGLVGAGANGGAVVAALMVFRSVTFLLPILTGLFSVAWWRRVERRRPVSPVEAVDASQAAEPAPPAGVVQPADTLAGPLPAAVEEPVAGAVTLGQLASSVSTAF